MRRNLRASSMAIGTLLMVGVIPGMAGQAWVPDDYSGNLGQSSRPAARPADSRADGDFCEILPIYRDAATGELVVPKRAITLYALGGAPLRSECANVYNVLSPSNACSELTAAGKRRVAVQFYAAGRRYLDQPGSRQGAAVTVSAGPDVRYVMGCLRSARSEAAFVDCLDIRDVPVAMAGPSCPR